MDLDEDPFLIESWAEYSQACINAQETWRFRRALGSYIYTTNKPILEGLREYGVRRTGEWAKEDLFKRIKKRNTELLSESNESVGVG